MNLSITIIISILTSLIAAIIYGLLIANNEDRIREYLKVRARGLVRKIYVKAFVAAARGKDKIADTSNHVLLLLFIAIASTWGLHYSLDKKLNTFETQVENFYQTNKGQLSKEEEIKKAEKLIEESQKPFKQLKLTSHLLNITAYVFLYLGFFIWRPYAMMRKRFSHEMEIYMHRIQGLATKPELSQLAVLESKVTNEETLKNFILATKDIAKRHGVEELVYTFDLWSKNINAV